MKLLAVLKLLLLGALLVFVLVLFSTCVEVEVCLEHCHRIQDESKVNCELVCR